MFYEKLNDAKAHVSEPPQPKLKLNMSGGTTPASKQQLKLKLRQSPGSESGTPGARSSATPGVIVDGDALQRQQRHVMDATHRPSRPSSSGKAGTPSATSNPFAGPRGASASIPTLPSRAAGSPALNGVKQDVQSPALSAVRPGSTAPDGQRLNIPNQAPPAVMAPPHATPRPASGSPLPNGVNGYATPYQAPTYYAPPQAPRVDCLRKTPLKSTYLPTLKHIIHFLQTNIDSRHQRSPHSQNHTQHPPGPQRLKTLVLRHLRSQNQNRTQRHHRCLTFTLLPPNYTTRPHCAHRPSLPPLRYRQREPHPGS